jgi:glucokinase
MPAPVTPPLESRRSGLFAGLDIGGTKTEAIVVDGALNLRGRVRQATDTRDPAGLAVGAAAAVRAALRQAGAALPELAGVGVGVPGQVNPETGEVRLAANLNLAAYPLGPALTQALDAPVFLENDVRLAAVGVYRWLRAREPVQNVAYLSVGTGVSAGLVVNGRLYRGSHGMAGEIGHVVVEPDGRVCKCGARGCLETIVAGPAIAQQALDAGFAPAKALDAGAVYRAAAAGDAAAQAVVARVSSALGLAIQWLVMAYDVDKVVLGGGVSGAGAAFLTPIMAVLSRLREQSDLMAALLAADKVTVLPVDYNPGTWGAVLLAQEGAQRPAGG